MALAGGANQAAQRWKSLLEHYQRADRNSRRVGGGAGGASHGGGHSHGPSSSSGGGQHQRASSRGSDHLGGDEAVLRG
jgi:hypothetical protein